MKFSHYGYLLCESSSYLDGEMHLFPAQPQKKKEKGEHERISSLFLPTPKFTHKKSASVPLHTILIITSASQQEPRPHLFSQMFARLQLMRAVREVFHSALATFHLPPLSQIWSDWSHTWAREPPPPPFGEEEMENSFRWVWEWSMGCYTVLTNGQLLSIPLQDTFC